MGRIAKGLLILLSLAACDGDTPAGPDSLAGTYVLQRLTIWGDGTTVLTLMPPDATGSLTLTEDRYDVSMSVPDGGISTSTLGSYTVSGSSITFTPDGGGPADANEITTDGRQITVADSIVDRGVVTFLSGVFVPG